MSVSANLTSGPGYGVFFRSNGDPGATTFSAYCFQYDTGFSASGSFVLRKFQYGGQTALKWVNMPAGYAQYGTSHTTSISAVRDHIVCKVGASLVVQLASRLHQRSGPGRRRRHGLGQSEQGGLRLCAELDRRHLRVRRVARRELGLRHPAAAVVARGAGVSPEWRLRPLRGGSLRGRGRCLTPLPVKR